RAKKSKRNCKDIVNFHSSEILGMKRIAVIGSGFAGLSAACFMAREGHDVTVIEKNSTPGGRARAFTEAGFTFDMGPSWYWMPDVFEKFFGSFNKKTSDFYDLERLDPSYRIIYDKNDIMDIPAKMEELEQLFEKLQPGSSAALRTFLKEGEFKYNIGMRDLVYKPGISLSELMDIRLV